MKEKEKNKQYTYLVFDRAPWPELSHPFSRNIAYKRDKSSPDADDRTQLHSYGRH